jgi:hypothetical protein
MNVFLKGEEMDLLSESYGLFHRHGHKGVNPRK